MRTFGRTLQGLALIVLPVAMLLELTGGLGRHFGLSDLLIALGFGVASFMLGRLVEGYAGAA
jgi:hypothetical protein